MNVSIQFGYQVKTEAVFQKGVAEIGRSASMNTFFNGNIATPEHMSFKTRFAAAVEAGLGALQNGAKVDTKYASKPAFYN